VATGELSRRSAPVERVLLSVPVVGRH
jgi:hypothetical protein